ncbi:MAG: hypothetical protein JWR83_3086 [Aeromicrobium sp.]|nr:hypothetical protein [Aeromicrobium sp.]
MNPEPPGSADRVWQLRTFADLCTQASAVFEQGDADTAAAYAATAGKANHLINVGFEQADLNALVLNRPSHPTWLNPKYPDFDAPRSDWQEAAAVIVEELEVAGFDLRIVGSLD